PMEVVGPGLDHEVRNRGLAAAEFGAERAGLQLELADHLGRRRHLVVAAALQIPSQRNAFNQDLVRVVATAIDRPFERAADRPGQTRKNELLNLTLTIADTISTSLIASTSSLKSNINICTARKITSLATAGRSPALRREANRSR